MLINSKIVFVSVASTWSNRKLRTTGFIILSFVALMIIYCHPQNERLSRTINVTTAHSQNAVNIYKWRHPVCGCTRNIRPRSLLTNGSQQLSRCGPAADIRGPHQLVLSYSFYGNIRSDYFLGIERNAKAIAKLYPGWVMRLYHDIPPTHQKSLLCKTLCDYPLLDDCYVDNLDVRLNMKLKKKFGMLWRFVPMGDPLVDILNVRDLDSTVFEREMGAVHEWLLGNRTWHSMRDHPGHIKPILGGGWGVKNSKNVTKMAALLDTMLKYNGTKKYGYDEWLLAKFVYPEASKSLLAHDSFNCKRYPKSVPFPTQRINKTFMNDHIERSPKNIIKKMCPISCRPPNHQDWLYC